MGNWELSPEGEILNNQTLSAKEPETGTCQPKPLQKPTWTDIQPHDLQQNARSEALWHQAIQLGHLKHTQPDRVNFFAAIAHALRVAKYNACGLLRTVVEQRLWHFLSQADESIATQRLRRATDTHTTPFLEVPADRRGEVNEPPALSEDAMIVQTVTADLQRAGVTSDVFRTIQRHGYLRDWNQERWLRAEQEVAQARLLWARQQYHTMDLISIGEVIEEVDDDESLHDG